MIAVFDLGRKALVRFALLTGLLALAACGDVSFGALGSGPSVNTSKPIPVALLLPKGSEQSGDAQLASSLENAARLAMTDLDGVEIDLRVYGTAGTAAGAQTAATQAMDDGAKIILGPVYAAGANAAGLVAAKRGVNVLAFSNNTSIAGGNVFVLGHTFDNTARRLLGYAAAQGRTRVVTVHSNEVAGLAARDAIAKASAGTSAQVVANVPYAFSQQGVVQAISQVRSAARGNEADTIFLAANTAGALPMFSQLLPEAGLSTETYQYMGLTRWDIPPQTLALPGVQGGWFALPDPARSQAFDARYEAATGAPPHPIAGLAYDGIAAVGALAKTGQSDALTVQALTQGAGFQGVNGIFRLRSDGSNERGLAVATVRDKQVVVIDPAPRSFGGAGF